MKKEYLRDEDVPRYAQEVRVTDFIGTGFVHVTLSVSEGQSVDSVATRLFEVLCDRGKNGYGDMLERYPYYLVRHTNGAYLVVAVGPHPDVSEYPPLRVVVVMEPGRDRGQLRVTTVGYEATQKLVESTSSGFKPRREVMTQVYA